MYYKTVISVVGVLVLTSVGCTRPPPAPTTRPANDALTAFTLRGQDTRIAFDFRLRRGVSGLRDLRSDELCCLTVGDALLMCTIDGSYLQFGPKDGIILVKDNPFSRLRPVENDPERDKLILTYGTLFFIASSIDRLPDALAGYLKGFESHRRQAMALIHKLLQDGGANVPAKVQGGTFSILIHLSQSGRDKLNEAIQSDGADGETYVMGGN